MRPIESELHEVLEEIAPETLNLEDQARIIATAASIYNNAVRLASRTTGKTDQKKVHEARLMDSLLQAMGELDDWTPTTAGQNDFTATYVDARGLSPHQILNFAAANLVGLRYANDFGMDVLNEEDFDSIINGSDDSENWYDIEDGEEEAHPSSLFFTPGRPKHRSDSQNRGAY